METLVLMAEGSRISSLLRAKGSKEDTILAWLRETAQHAEELETVLMKDFKVKRAQLDALTWFGPIKAFTWPSKMIRLENGHTAHRQ